MAPTSKYRPVSLAQTSRQRMSNYRQYTILVICHRTYYWHAFFYFMSVFATINMPSIQRWTLQVVFKCSLESSQCQNETCYDVVCWTLQRQEKMYIPQVASALTVTSLSTRDKSMSLAISLKLNWQMWYRQRQEKCVHFPMCIVLISQPNLSLSCKTSFNFTCLWS